jgi:hypothetical protein
LEVRINHRFNHGEHGEHGERHNLEPLTTEAQRHREKQEKNTEFVFDFLCVSAPLWLMVFLWFSVVPVVPVVANSFFAFLRALRG